MALSRSVRVLAVLLLAWLAQGCSIHAPIRLDDHDQFAPGGRASYEIWPGVDERRRGALLDLVTQSSDEGEPEGGEPVTARSAGVRPTIAIDASITHVEGRDDQQIEAGDSVDLDGVLIPGPTRIRTKAENLSGDVAARGGVRLFDIVSLEGILGVDIEGTEVRVRGGGEDVSHDRLRPGFLTGARAALRPIPLFDVYAQYTFSVGDEFDVEEQQVGVELHLTRNVYVYTAYRWWKYREDHLDGTSGIRLDIRGPTAGLGLGF